MSSHIPKKINSAYQDLPVIRCFCGEKILLITDARFMSESIEMHVEKHKRKIKDLVEAESEAECIRDDLITQVFEKASKL